jgi:hypothetical protein
MNESTRETLHPEFQTFPNSKRFCGVRPWGAPKLRTFPALQQIFSLHVTVVPDSFASSLHHSLLSSPRTLTLTFGKELNIRDAQQFKYNICSTRSFDCYPTSQQRAQ